MIAGAGFAMIVPAGNDFDRDIDAVGVLART
jgi:hypothetical protein